MKRSKIFNLKPGSAVCLALVIVSSSIVVAACGGSGDSSSTAANATSTSSQENTETAEGGTPPVGNVDVGTGKPIPLSVEDLNIAFVASGLQTPLGVAEQKGVEKVASEHDIPVTTFDGLLEPNKQYSLFQNVIGSGKYNVIITNPTGGEQACEILSKTAPEKGIVVVVMDNPICGLEFESAKGDGLWAPGTLASAGMITNIEGLQAQADACAKETGGGEAILINGNPEVPSSKLLTEAYKNTDLKIVADYATKNYEASESLEETAAGLTAHPDVSVIATIFPPLTEAAMQAVRSAGKTPGVDVKFCNLPGGTEKMLDFVKSGEVTVDNYVNNEWISIAATQSVIDAVEGKEVPRVIVPGTDGKIEKSGTTIWPTIITKANVDQFEPTGQ